MRSIDPLTNLGNVVTHYAKLLIDGEEDKVDRIV